MFASRTLDDCKPLQLRASGSKTDPYTVFAKIARAGQWESVSAETIERMVEAAMPQNPARAAAFSGTASSSVAARRWHTADVLMLAAAMHIVTYNIRCGKGLDGWIDLGRIAAAVRGADVIALQEVDYLRYQAQAAKLGRHLNAHHWVASHAAFASRIRRPRFGTMVLSRFPNLQSRRVVLLDTLGLDECDSLTRGRAASSLKIAGRSMKIRFGGELNPRPKAMMRMALAPAGIILWGE